MLVTCENCRTAFNLADGKVTPEGVWVRCSKCREIFQVFPIGQAPPPEELALEVEGSPAAEAAPVADFGLQRPEGEAGKKGSGWGRVCKVTFWSLATLLILAVVLIGTLVALDRLGLASGLVDRARALPVLKLLFTPGGPDKLAAVKVVDTSGLSLTQVRGYFRVNQQAGRVFVIQGLVENQHPQSRAGVFIRGKPSDDKGATVHQAVVYAGAQFNPKEPRSMPVADMQVRLGLPADAEGERYVMDPQGSLPFMLIFPNLPDNLATFTTEVMGSETIPAVPA